MTNNVVDEINANYKPLIPERILKESSLVKLPKPFEALFTKEHSLKYALMESLSALSPMAEYLFPTQDGQKRYIDIYCSDGKNRYGIEVKISVGEISKEQMDNYFGSMELDFIYLAYPVIYETEDSLLQLYHKAKGGSKDINRIAFAKTAYDSFGTKGRIGNNLNINQQIRANRTSDLNEVHDNLRPGAFDFLKNGLDENIGIIAINPFGGVQILSEAKFKLNVVQRHGNKSESRVDYNISKPEEKIKFAIWNYFRQRKMLIAAEAPLESSSKVSESWFGPSGNVLDIEDGYKKSYKYLSGSLKKSFKQKVGYKKTVREGTYIIDFVVLDNCDNGKGNELIGIECKSSSKYIDFKQLKSYYESHEIDRLYIAVGDLISNKINTFSQQKLDDSENWINEIGIIQVTNDGDVIINKKANKLNAFNKSWFTITKQSPKNDRYNFKEIPSIPRGN